MGHCFEYVDLSRMIKGVELPRKIFRTDRKKVVQEICESIPRPWIAYLGSGDYHYLSYFLIKILPEKPFLILFDNHFDMDLTPDNLLSCGSWARKVLIENLIQGILVIGASQESRPLNFWDPRINYISNPNIYIDLDEFKQILTYSLYISIDKDVLHKSIIRTNWDQGIMKESSLFNWLLQIKTKGKITGVDFCGESFEDPVTNLSDKKNKGEHKRINNKIVKLFTGNFTKSA